MKVYQFALILTLITFVSPSKTERSKYYQPTLREVLHPVEYFSIYPSGMRDHRNLSQLKDAKRKLEALLKKTTNSYRRKGIERELNEVGFFIAERRYES